MRVRGSAIKSTDDCRASVHATKDNVREVEANLVKRYRFQLALGFKVSVKQTTG